MLPQAVPEKQDHPLVFFPLRLMGTVVVSYIISRCDVLTAVRTGFTTNCSVEAFSQDLQDITCGKELILSVVAAVTGSRTSGSAGGAVSMSKTTIVHRGIWKLGDDMSVAAAAEPRILHSLPGRMRVHVSGWKGQEKRRVETQLRGVMGIQRVQANTLTGNMLIYFDPAVTNEQAILAAVGILDVDMTAEPAQELPPPPVISERRGRTMRARIAVRGLDRDPHLTKRVVDHLGRQPGVHRASVNPLTGRVLVEFEEQEAKLEDLIAEVVGLELPELPGEDRPTYPLDPGPLIQSAIRTIGATLGLGLLTTRRILGLAEPLPGAPAALRTAVVIGILQGIPPLRFGLRRLLGRTGADLLFSLPAIVTLTIAGSPLGLVLSGVEALRLLTEIQARQRAWRRHEERDENAVSIQPGAVIHLETGERTPLPAKVIEGTGIAIGSDGMPLPAVQAGMVPSGALLYGGPFALQLQSGEAFQPFILQPRPPLTPSLHDRYLQIVGPFSFIYAATTALLTRSFSQTLAALLLVSSRSATVGLDCADLGTSARVLRAEVTVVGTRTNRNVRLPNLVLVDGIRPLTDGLELSSVLSLVEDYDTAKVLAQAAGVAAAAGFPWGGAFRVANRISAGGGLFDGKAALAYAEGEQYVLGPAEDWASLPEAAQLRQQGNYVLVLRRVGEERSLGIFALRPQLAPGVEELVQMCQCYGVRLGILTCGDQIATQAFAHRAAIQLLDSSDAVEAIRAKQQEGALVAFVSDNSGAAAAFAACDLAVGVTDDRTPFPARADLLAPDAYAVAAIIEAAARREATVRDSVGLSALSNLVGAVWGFLQMPRLELASRLSQLAAFTALVDGWLRLRGGQRSALSVSHLVDPHPERWGRRSVERVLNVLDTSREGLTSAQAAVRQLAAVPKARRNQLLAATLDQLRSPLMGMLAAGAGFSLLLGAVGDVAIIVATLVANIAVGVWQEHKADRVAETLERLGSSTARVLRDGKPVMIPATEVVPGDVLLLAPGDRVSADARVLDAQGLEVDEAALTGESLPVSKAPDGGTDESRVILEGSDVTTGTGRAVVFAVGRHTRMGAIAASLSTDELEQSPLGARLSRMLRMILPLSMAGGFVVTASGLLLRRPLASQLALGVSMVLAAVPEGLPLLARVGEAGVARRLAGHNAVVRRLSSIEALGRVDVACSDKTGTMTKGRLSLNLVTAGQQEATLPTVLSANLRHVLLTAAFASPYPEAQGATAHPTDIAVIQGAQEAGLGAALQVKHDAELSFDPTRSFHATVVQGRLCVKGAPEALLPRCSWGLQSGKKLLLDEDTRNEWLAHSLRLAGRGLRILMVAEGTPDAPLENPQGLTALGFVGISDPLRPTVREAVRRCRDAGVRVIMITGDHPVTARVIAREAGLIDNEDTILLGTEIAELQNAALDERLEHTAVIARATPLDKLRIIESLQRRGHTVAMTGDGVNDAPALRLADIGVAMGRGGTEVARQTADVVLADDDFSTLVEALVEGRSFWRNIRRALGLLLGGNLGELGLVVGASVLGLSTPLTARQILAMNAITDILPALAVAFQHPEHHNLAGLKREGASALDKPLRREIWRRAITSAVPALVSYIVMLGSSTLAEARTLAFGTIISTQLAQTLAVGRSEEGLTSSVLRAVAGSSALLLALLLVPPLRNFFRLVTPGPLGWTLIGGCALGSVVFNRILALLPVRSAMSSPAI